MFDKLFDRIRGTRATLASVKEDILMGTRKGNHAGSVMLRSDGRWRGRIQLGSKEDGTPDTRTVYGRTREEVEAKLADTRTQYERGALLDSRGDRLTLAEYLNDQWLPAVKSTVGANTYLSYSQITRNHLVPRLGKIRLANLSPRQIQTALGAMHDEGLSPQTVKTAQRVLHRALVYAIRWKYLASNPAELVDTPPIPKVRRPVLSREQIARLLALEDRMTLLWKVAIATGARQGELLGLQWRDHNVAERTLEIRRSYSPKHGYKTPKNGKSRTVPIPAAVSDELVRRRSEAKNQAPDGPMFQTGNGTPYLGPNVTRMFQRKLEDAGIDTRFRFHDLRHTHVTQVLRAGGVPVAEVSSMVGHYSPAVTHGLYDHASDDQADRYRAAQEGLLGA